MLSCASGSAAVTNADPAAQAQRLPVIQLTQISATDQGYIADPHPVRRAPAAAQNELTVAGTTRAVLNGAFPLNHNALPGTPLKVDTGVLR